MFKNMFRGAFGRHPPDPSRSGGQPALNEPPSTQRLSAKEGHVEEEAVDQAAVYAARPSLHGSFLWVITVFLGSWLAHPKFSKLHLVKSVWDTHIVFSGNC